MENLKIPDIAFIANLSPLKDSAFDEPDVDAYKLIPRGSRGKMTRENEAVFLIGGQNFFISLSVIIIWLCWKLFGLCLSDENKIIGFFSFVYQFMIDLFFFDFQMICTTEASIFDYNSIKNVSSK